MIIIILYILEAVLHFNKIIWTTYVRSNPFQPFRLLDSISVRNSWSLSNSNYERTASITKPTVWSIFLSRAVLADRISSTSTRPATRRWKRPAWCTPTTTTTAPAPAIINTSRITIRICWTHRHRMRPTISSSISNYRWPTAEALPTEVAVLVAECWMTVPPRRHRRTTAVRITGSRRFRKCRICRRWHIRTFTVCCRCTTSVTIITCEYAGRLEMRMLMRILLSWRQWETMWKENNEFIPMNAYSFDTQ